MTLPGIPVHSCCTNFARDTGARVARRKRGFGRLRQLPSGRWQAAYVGPDTKLHRAPRTYATESDAEGWLAGERRKIDLGTWGSIERSDGVTLRAYTDIIADIADRTPCSGTATNTDTQTTKTGTAIYTGIGLGTGTEQEHAVFVKQSISVDFSAQAPACKPLSVSWQSSSSTTRGMAGVTSARQTRRDRRLYRTARKSKK